MSTVALYDVFSAISDPVRRRILDMLREGKKAVTELINLGRHLHKKYTGRS